MTAEEFFVDFLSTALDVHVAGDMPEPKPLRFVTLEQTGSRTENHIYHPTLAVQSWAESRAAAAALNEAVKDAMSMAIFHPRVSSCELETDYYFPELELKHPRYQAIYNITYL